MSITLATEFEVIDCANCGMEFGVLASYIERRRKDGRSFNCPNGHSLSFGKSEADKLREQLEAKQRRLDSAEARITHLKDQNDATERALRAQRGANTKLRKRVSNGVCPCCNRTFADLGRHMSGQHPDYVNEHTIAVVGTVEQT